MNIFTLCCLESRINTKDLFSDSNVGLNGLYYVSVNGESGLLYVLVIYFFFRGKWHVTLQWLFGKLGRLPLKRGKSVSHASYSQSRTLFGKL